MEKISPSQPPPFFIFPFLLRKNLWKRKGDPGLFSPCYALVLVSVLMSLSTALIGPLTFYGFLVAALTYQAVPTYDHRYLFPMSLVIGFLVITGSYFFMYHIFRAQGVVSVIIEWMGGIAFLVVIFRRGAL